MKTTLALGLVLAGYAGGRFCHQDEYRKEGVQEAVNLLRDYQGRHDRWYNQLSWPLKDGHDEIRDGYARSGDLLEQRYLKD